MTVVSKAFTYRNVDNTSVYHDASVYEEVLEPDDDFRSAISMDEFKIRAREVVKKAYKRYINERNHITQGTRIS